MEDLTGRRFGRLTVVGFSHKRINPTTLGRVNRYYYWNCKCDCGNDITLTATSLRNRYAQSCGCLHKELAKERGHKNRIGFGEASFNDTYNRYKTQAVRRNLDFMLTKEQFKEITSKNCYYCNKEPNQISHSHTEKYYGLYYGNGIDRLDNNIGYILENCVPCCKVCNMAKMTMTELEFKDWIIRVYNNFVLNERNSGF